MQKLVGSYLKYQLKIQIQLTSMYLENLFNNAQSCLEDATETWWEWWIQCHWKVRNYFFLLQSFSQRTGIWRKKVHASKCLKFLVQNRYIQRLMYIIHPLQFSNDSYLYLPYALSIHLNLLLTPSRLFQKIWHRFQLKNHMSFKLREKCSVKSCQFLWLYCQWTQYLNVLSFSKLEKNYF